MSMPHCSVLQCAVEQDHLLAPLDAAFQRAQVGIWLKNARAAAAEKWSRPVIKRSKGCPTRAAVLDGVRITVGGRGSLNATYDQLTEWAGLGHVRRARWDAVAGWRIPGLMILRQPAPLSGSRSRPRAAS